jgi:hypothetical protein
MPEKTNTEPTPDEVKAQVAETVHIPEEDHAGAVLTDRAFTPEEAAALDEANRQRLLANRQRRFLKRAARPGG